MAEDKKVVEEKRYAILSSDSIRAFAEANGHPDVPDEVANLLAEDVVYRLREATQNSCQFMRHCKRKRMTTDDFNRALRNSDVPPVLGYGLGDRLPFLQTKDGDLYFSEDKEVDLAHVISDDEESTEEVPQQLGKTSIKGHWLAVEGTQKSVTMPQGKLNGKMAKGVSEELLIYYDNMTKAILSTDNQITEHALKDLRTNSNIAPLLPYFVNFVSNGVKTVSHDITQMTKLMHTVKSLINNPALYLEPRPYLTLLVQGIQYCLLEPLAASINPSNDHWALRDYAARLLVQITNDWSNAVNQLMETNIQALQDAFLDQGKPFCSHYGAIMGIIAFGAKDIEDIILPHMQIYWPHLEKTIQEEKTSLVKSDAYKVYWALMLAAELVIRSRTYQIMQDKMLGKSECVSPEPAPPPTSTVTTTAKKKDNKNKDVEDLLGPVITLPEIKDPYKLLAKIYKEMSEYFGDALAIRLAPQTVHDYYQPKKEGKYISLADEDTKKSGEELLQNFLQVSQRTDEADSKSDNHSYEMDDEERSSRSDPSISDESYMGDTADLTIKSSFSDPSKGIKLTILKRPKRTDSVSEDEKSREMGKLDGRTGKRRRLSSRGGRDPMLQQYFELVPLQNKKTQFIFHYAGKTQRSEPKKKQFMSPQHQMSHIPLTLKTEYQLLEQQLRPYGKRKCAKYRNALLSATYHGSSILDIL